MASLDSFCSECINICIEITKIKIRKEYKKYSVAHQELSKIFHGKPIYTYLVGPTKSLQPKSHIRNMRSLTQ